MLIIYRTKRLNQWLIIQEEIVLMMITRFLMITSCTLKVNLSVPALLRSSQLSSSIRTEIRLMEECCSNNNSEFTLTMKRMKRSMKKRRKVIIWSTTEMKSSIITNKSRCNTRYRMMGRTTNLYTLMGRGQISIAIKWNKKAK